MYDETEQREWKNRAQLPWILPEAYLTLMEWGDKMYHEKIYLNLTDSESVNTCSFCSRKARRYFFYAYVRLLSLLQIFSLSVALLAFFFYNTLEFRIRTVIRKFTPNCTVAKQKIPLQSI